ncbi:putative MFS family arabinose efflux permease [Kitasatospora sp. MAA4]|uniref:MFS transporter n=1 Tax=Kitasatospora sp. MAA4 TaxID=3035093 RepID=UPI002475C6B3|nr:MFS transporter [Kitasatospora sp. MAA4]MDH6137607.1 putative MFS family arabinose efflux permease [Kitasatospora sp. MAA4]
MSSSPSYRAVLRAPQAARTFSAALIGRLSYGTVSLSLTLTLTRSTGSYAATGGVLALFGVTVAVLSPVRAGLIDRHGPRRALPPMALLYAAALLGITAAHGVLPLSLLALAAGACAPPLGPVMRGLWSELLPQEELLQRAYSLDTVAEELLYVSGPLLVGLIGPTPGLLLSAALVLGGTLALVGAPVARAPRPSAAATKAGRSGLVPGIGRPVLVSAALGLSLGALGLLMVCAGQGRPGAVAWLEAALATGSALGGLAYGAVHWRRPARVRLGLVVTGLGAVLAVTGLAPGLGGLAVLVGLAGLFVSPALATAYLVADECAAPEQRTRAGAWLNTAFNAGSTAGTAAAGLATGALPPAVCFALAAVPLLAVGAVPVLGTGLRRSRPATALSS